MNKQRILSGLDLEPIIIKAMDDLFKYWEAKQKQMDDVERAIRIAHLHSQLNDRQLALLSRAIRKPDAVFSIESHRSSHRIAYQSARTDLMKLVELGLLTQRQLGKALVFAPVKNIKQKLRGAPKSKR